MSHKKKSRLADYIRRIRTYFITGLLVIAPVYVTFAIIRWIFNLIDKPIREWFEESELRPWLAEQLNVPEQALIPYGIGVVVSLLIVLSVGLFARNYFGGRLIRFLERLLSRIPLVSRIYHGAKQVSSAFLERSKALFQAVVLVEYPRRGVYSMGFVTRTESGELSHKVGKDLVCVFMSTTPNPTSGFFIVVPRDDLIFLDMSVEDGIKMVISGGVVVPPDGGGTARPLTGREGKTDQGKQTSLPQP